jgi:hypothetical protein
MLRWSRNETGDGVAHAAALEELAAAQAGDEDERLASARTRLLQDAGPEVVVDACAVAANFEMMTRLADGTGAMQSESGLLANAALIDELGLEAFESARRPSHRPAGG